MTTTTTTTKRLVGRAPWDDLSLSARALLFGELVLLAAPHVEHYHSDLFHDALWIEKYFVGEPITFYFGADEWGTAIGDDEQLVRQMRNHAWKLDVTVDVSAHDGEEHPEWGGTWSVTIEQLADRDIPFAVDADGRGIVVCKNTLPWAPEEAQ